MEAIKKTLFLNGYSLISNDSTYISTTSKEIDKAAISVKFMILKSDSITYLKGLIKSTLELELGGVTLKDDYSRLSFIGEKNSPLRRAWNEMDMIAKLLSPTITYSKQ